MLTNRVQDLLRREADIAVRMSAAEAGAAGGAPHRRASTSACMRTATTSRAMARRARVDELAQHSLIGFDQETPYLRAARKAPPQWTARELSRCAATATWRSWR